MRFIYCHQRTMIFLIIPELKHQNQNMYHYRKYNFSHRNHKILFSLCRFGCECNRRGSKYYKGLSLAIGKKKLCCVGQLRRMTFQEGYAFNIQTALSLFGLWQSVSRVKKDRSLFVLQVCNLLPQPLGEFSVSCLFLSES